MRTASRKVAPSASAISVMLRKACLMRAASPATSVLVCGSTPRIPATNTKSPARAPRLQAPVGLMAPFGASVLTPSGEVDRAAAMACASRFRNAGLQGERMQRAAHLAFQRVVDHLVLLHPRLAAKRGGDHGRRIMVTVAGEIADRHFRVRD